MFQQNLGVRGQKAREAWEAKFAAYRKEYPELAKQLEQIWHHELPEGWDAEMVPFAADPKGLATRASSSKVLNQVAKCFPWLLGGSADLAPSNLTTLKFDGAGDFSAENYAGRTFHFGIREHAMAAICNGMALCGLRSFGATFFVFSDYLRHSLRLSSLMKLPVLYIFTHDSIGVGEDGPTHQPVEHLAALRSLPGVITIRPADANEVTEAYRVAMLEKSHPVALALSRQNMPTLDRTKYAAAAGLAKGGYVVADAEGGKPSVILIGTGSEVAVCLEAYEKLKAEGVAARVVSLPSWELFEAQSAEYRDSVLPPSVTARVGVEAGIEMGWSKYLGPKGRFVGMQGFGISCPMKQAMEHFGFTAANVVAQAKAVL